MVKKSNEQLAVDIQKLLKQREAETAALKKLMASLEEVGKSVTTKGNAITCKKATK
jgi:hypothetical protein